jgi:hypothetical protein
MRNSQTISGGTRRQQALARHRSLCEDNIKIFDKKGEKAWTGLSESD